MWERADGQGVDTPAVWWPHFASAVIEMQTSSYNMSATTVMIRARTAPQAQADSSYTVQNRLLGEGNGMRREPFNSTPTAANPISSGSLHVRCTPMWAPSTCR